MDTDAADQDLPHGFSEASLRLAIAKLLWIYSCTAGFGALCFCVYLAIRMIVIWKVAMYSQAISPLGFSILVGTDIGVLTVIVCLVFLVPRMIMTWITAIVFEVIFDRLLSHQKEIVANGKKLAREISLATLRNALKGGEIAAVVAAVATLMGLIILRVHVSDWTGVSMFHW